MLISRSFDGELIARVIEKFGYRSVRGSSSRGAVGGLLEMGRELQSGRAVAFTVDGPRGPFEIYTTAMLVYFLILYPIARGVDRVYQRLAPLGAS